MSRKLFWAGVVVAGAIALGAIPVLAASNSADTSYIQQVSQDTSDKQPPKMKNGEQPPEPPKDKDGNPLPPPDGKNVQGADHSGQTPPEPPKDKDGKPLPPPDGFQHSEQQK